jgi:transposase InsO family protein
MLCSMSRKGNCWDNAPMESFFHTLKTEHLHHRDYRIRWEAKADIFEYIEVFHSRGRGHSIRGYFTPAEFDTNWHSNEEFERQLACRPSMARRARKRSGGWAKPHFCPALLSC